MDYAQIISRVQDNVGREGNRAVGLSDIYKNDIYDALLKIYRITEPIKAEISTDITADAQELELPDDFFVPLEVIFNSSDNQRFPSKELEYEEYMRWNPTIELVTTSFSEIVTSASPQAGLYTQENIDFDGLVGFTFSDTNPQKLLWKPAIDGSVILYYVTYPEIEITDLAGLPDIHKVFHELIVLEVTIKQLVRKLDTITEEVKLYGLNGKIKHFKEERTEMLSNLAGFVNRNTSTPIMTPFDFLSDYSMLVRNSNT